MDNCCNVNQHNGAGYVSDSGGGHHPAAPCHPAWSPFSPSSHHIVSRTTLSPRMMHGNSYVQHEPGGPHHAAQLQQQILSGVPGTSPPSRGYMTGVWQHGQPRSRACSWRGSPAGPMRNTQPLHSLQYVPSPAPSDCSSMIPNSPRVHSGFIQGYQSPRMDVLRPTPPRIVPSQVLDTGQGPGHQVTHFNVPANHQPSHMMKVYAPAAVVPQAPQLHNLTTVMAATSIATSANSPRSPGAYMPRPCQELGGPAQPAAQAQSGQNPFPHAPAAVAAPVNVYPVSHAPVSMPQASRGATPQEMQHAAPLSSSSHAQPGSTPQACGANMHTRSVNPAGSASMAPVSGYQGMPLTPAQTLSRYAGVNLLTEYEKGEVLDYKEIFYIGAGAVKHRPHPSRPEYNRGFDDERGDYKAVVRDHLAYRYEILNVLGKGSFGQVLKVYDYCKLAHCAVKIIRNKARFHEQAKVELQILHHLVRKDPHKQNCVVHIVDSFEFRGHLCICFELLSHNLYEYMRFANFQGINVQLVQKFAVQLVHALCFLKRERIIHCDLKPENILIEDKASSKIKVIDFGSSCYMNRCMYTYIQSRFYRSPEVILGLPYGHEIDMWSLGCLLCELVVGKALFQGENEQNQLALYTETLGYPPRAMMKNCKAGQYSGTRIKVDSNGKLKLEPDSTGRVPRAGTRPVSEILRGQDHLFVDLMTKILQWDPATRITPEDAICHPWILDVENAAGTDGLASTRGVMQTETKLKTSAIPSEARSNRGPLTEAGNVQHAKEAPLQPLGMQGQYNH